MEMKIIWLEPAEQYLQEIFNYYKYEAGEVTALKIVRKLYERSDILVKNPQIGPCEPSLEDRLEGFRYLVEGNYKIIYYIDGNEILISVIFDCRRDPMALRELVTERKN